MSSSSQVIIVTGAGSGIGRSIALRLASDGNRVVCVGRRVERLPQGAEFMRLGADVSIPTEMTRVVETAVEAFERIDGVVAAAGIIRSAKLDAIPQADIESQVATNFLGTLYTIRAALPQLRKSRGAIVTLSSTLSQRPTLGTAVYAATKGAIEALTRGLAIELSLDNVRINCIAPALVRSEIWLAAGMSPATYEDLIVSRGRSNPLGRIGEPTDIAELAIFLLSPRAGWLTGACIPVDGGSSLGARPT
jgi:NAD(P)-dependent dehydrogenase (short-subunit alcohol dehydrogenase family)